MLTNLDMLLASVLTLSTNTKSSTLLTPEFPSYPHSSSPSISSLELSSPSLLSSPLRLSSLNPLSSSPSPSHFALTHSHIESHFWTKSTIPPQKSFGTLPISQGPYDFIFGTPPICTIFNTLFTHYPALYDPTLRISLFF